MSMSVSGSPHTTPRVREQARDAVAVMVFSAGASVATTVVLLLLMALGR
ncbi:hypothetical protein ncot_06890 [Nocardioides sp. JQ2195]|nr:hypothetical protein [Nocardioides sp. JQ2195]QIX26357.1 hypothetical protein ncot_06890 [Nocardioides sp. JQ2195]